MKNNKSVSSKQTINLSQQYKQFINTKFLNLEEIKENIKESKRKSREDNQTEDIYLLNSTPTVFFSEPSNTSLAKGYNSENNLKVKMPNFINNYEELLSCLEFVNKDQHEPLQRQEKKKRKSIKLKMTDSPLKQLKFAFELKCGGESEDEIQNFKLTNFGSADSENEEKLERGIKRKVSRSLHRESSLSNINF
jgi:hypothetical protein